MATATNQGGNLKFRCADVGQGNCSWEATGRNEEEIMRQVEQHGREKHNIQDWTSEMKNRVRGAIRRIAA